jgi:glycosyltransferase involved in cell wall biosynthesis
MSMSEVDRVLWVCAQLGSREHYAIPRVLHRAGRLRLLLTDYWTSPRGGVTALLPGTNARKAAQRFHPDLADVPVLQLGIRRLSFEAVARLRHRSTWETLLQRNRQFQDILLRRLRLSWLASLAQKPGVFFAYSYAALNLLRAFKEIGWKTVLGQIDAGIRGEEVVGAELRPYPNLQAAWSPAPAAYWQGWRGECELSDRVVVNSPWSREALVQSGVPAEKIVVIPLAFESDRSKRPARTYPDRFTAARPLRVLLLGRLAAGKGVHLAFDAARAMRDAPIEWQFAGPAEISPPADLVAAGLVRWSGPVARRETARLYAAADVFLLPTLSDGFALTQLEALASGLPVIASKRCGSVVREGENGCLIDPLTSEAIVEVVRRVLHDPEQLARMARASSVGAEFSLESLQRSLIRLQDDLFAT